MAHGYVYILSNKAMPGIYKIGMTTGCPYERATHLSYSTSCPLPFEVVCFAEFEDVRAAEVDMHDRFSEYRISNNREFFRFTLEDLITYACHCLCRSCESGCIDSVETAKYEELFDEFHNEGEVNTNPKGFHTWLKYSDFGNSHGTH